MKNQNQTLLPTWCLPIFIALLLLAQQMPVFAIKLPPIQKKEQPVTIKHSKDTAATHTISTKPAEKLQDSAQKAVTQGVEMQKKAVAIEQGGLFNLGWGKSILLILCILFVCLFEFVNGFHDTANAVANVIYTNTYQPRTAVFLAGIMNFLGVMVSSIWGYKVAMGIINLLPVEILTSQNIGQSLAMIFSLLLTAIIWNLGTWYFGLPASSSHTLIGSILGVVLAYRYITNTVMDWHKAQEIGLALLFSPLFGFLMAILIMLLLRFLVKTPKKKRAAADLLGTATEEDAWATESNIFKGAKEGKEPPRWIRYAMMVGSPGLAFAHGMNDGQKGIGLMMVILIGIAPTYFAIDASKNPADILPNVQKVSTIFARIDSTKLSTKMQTEYGKTNRFLNHLQTQLATINTLDDLPRENRFEIRKDIILAEKNIKKMVESGDLSLGAAEQDALKKEAVKMKVLTNYAPTWVLVLISLSLGIGTTIGWRRVVVTIGEKIGKNSLSYAQGFTADFMAMVTVTLATTFGLPVSTTHVLSSSVAGGFVAQRGTKNLQKGTLRNILLAWVLTLPVTIVLAAALYLTFRAIF